MRDRFKSFVWVALLAMCAVAFGPSISRALDSSATGSATAQVRSMGMDAHAEMAADAQSDSEDDAEDDPDCHGHPSCPLDCCALCAVAALPFTSAALFVPTWLPSERAAHPRPDCSSVGLDRHQRWASAVPRGPPSVS